MGCGGGGGYKRHNNDERKNKFRLVGTLTALKELHLAYNSVTRLPESIMNLTRLEVLDISENAITSLPDLFFASMEELHTFNAKNNQIGDVPASIARAKRLRTINFSQNNLTSIQVRSEMFSNLLELIMLDLSLNSALVIPAQSSNLGAQAIIQFLKRSEFEIVENHFTASQTETESENRSASLSAEHVTFSGLRQMRLTVVSCSDLPCDHPYVQVSIATIASPCVGFCC